jgi:hypothetical protein
MIVSKMKVSNQEYHKTNSKENYYSLKDPNISLP